MEFNGIMTPLVAIDPGTSTLKPSLEATYGPYDSIDTAYATIVNAFQTSGIPIGLTVGIISGQTIVDYWFNGGTAKANLIQKYPSGGTSGGTGYTLFVTPSVTEDSTTYLNNAFPTAVVGDHVVDSTLGNIYIKYSSTGWTKINGTVLSASVSPTASIVGASIMSYK